MRQRTARSPGAPPDGHGMTGASKAMAKALEGMYSYPLAEARAAAKLSQRELAARLGKEQSTVAVLEKKPSTTIKSLTEYVQAADGQVWVLVQFADGNFGVLDY